METTNVSFVTFKDKTFSDVHYDEDLVEPQTMKASGSLFKGEGVKVLDIMYETRTRECCNFALTTKDKSIPVHPCVLVMTCEYFFVAFKDRPENKIRSWLSLPNFESDVVEKVVSCMYKREIEINQDNVHSLYEVAQYVLFYALIKACEDFLKGTLSFTNCFSYCKTADLFSNDPIHENVLFFIKKNFDFIYENTEFGSLPIETVVFFLSSDDIQVAREEHVFFAIIRWINESHSRVQHLPRLLQCLRIDSLSKGFLEDQMETDPRIKNAMMNPPPSDLHRPTIRPSTIVKELGVVLRTNGCFHFYDMEDRTILTCDNPTKSSIVTSFSVYGTSIYVLTNKENAWGAQDTLYSIDFSSLCVQQDALNNSNKLQWRLEETLDRPRRNAITVILHGIFYVIGGIGENCLYEQTMDCFDIASRKWYQTMGPNEKRCRLSVVATTNSIIMAGGIRREKSIEEFCPSTQQWRFLQPMINHHVEPRLFVVKNKIISLCLVADQKGNCGEIYERGTDTWQLVSYPLHPEIVVTHGFVFKGDFFLSKSSYRSLSFFSNSSLKYCIETNSWTETTKIAGTLGDWVGSIFMTNFVIGRLQFS